MFNLVHSCHMKKRFLQQGGEEPGNVFQEVKPNCNSDQHYEMQPATVITEEVLEMPALAFSPLLSYKLEIKNLFRNKTMLYGGETEVPHDVRRLHAHLSSNKYSCGHTGESKVTTQVSRKPLLLDGDHRAVH